MTIATPRRTRVPRDVSARCGACGHTFADPDLFDRHRDHSGKHGACLEPQLVTDQHGDRVMFHRGGMWHPPGPVPGTRGATRGKRGQA